MSQENWTALETELRKVRPARAPQEFVQGLQQAVQSEVAGLAGTASSQATVGLMGFWRSWLKVLAPLAGAAVLLVLIVVNPQTSPPSSETGGSQPPTINEVELDQHLVAAFEGVAQIPGEPPVRFRCYGWQQALTLRNANGSVEVQTPQPRLEIVPVGFDVY